MRLRAFLVTSIAFFGFAIAAFSPVSSAADSTTHSAISWLKAQQKNDGGFEIAGYPGFETPDAVLAIAANSQTTSTWDTCTAYESVTSTKNSGRNPLHNLDNFADSPSLPAVSAAGLVVVADALGLDPASFDPDGDGSTDLVAVVDGSANADGSYGPPGVFTASIMAVIANKASDQPVSSQTISYIKSTQQANGSFNYLGDSTQSMIDIDTTGRTLQALAAAGLNSSDPVVAKSIKFLADNQQADGGFLGDFQTVSNPSSSSLVELGLTALGIDTSNSTWRDAADPALVGNPYIAPRAFLANLQQSDGHIETEYDGFGLNTIATSQSVQAIDATYIGGNTESQITNCDPGTPTTTTTPTVLANNISNTSTTAATVAAGTLAATGMSQSTRWMLVLGSLSIVVGALFKVVSLRRSRYSSTQ